MSSAPAIDGNTRLMVIMGDPIRQVRSPGVLSQIFAERQAGIVCLPLHVSASNLKSAWNGMRFMENLVGFGITIPHKQTALALCDSLDPMAERLGAINLVRRELDGSFRGYQFDGLGFVNGLLSRKIEVDGRRCQIIGAGGAAASIAFALADAGVSEIAIFNRDRKKAERLAAAVNEARGGNIAYDGLLVVGEGSLVVNATSLGMNESDPLPFSADRLGPGVIVADVIAKPEYTRLLTIARDQGAAVHSGIHMIAAQAPMIADCICEIWGYGKL